jgi:aspartyl protease family protein
MGLIEIGAVVRNPEETSKSAQVIGLVDTGATLTVLPRKIAASIGLSPKSKARVMTSGGPVEVDVSNAEVEISGKKETVRFVISDIIDRVLIGVTTLEILALAVDPVTGQLKESTYLLYKI